MMHDTNHRLVHPDTQTCYQYAYFWANIVFGANTNWWQGEHDLHHSATSTFDKSSKLGFFDPQAAEDVFCQAKEVVPFFRAIHHPILLSIQHYTILPLVLFVSKPGLCIDSIVNQGEKDPK